MSTEIVSENASKVDVFSGEVLKSVLATLTEQLTTTKNLINTVRTVIKDTDKQSKEIEKLRNKRTRTKSERSVNALPSGITKPVAITDELAKFLGVEPGTLVPRNEVTKGVANFVKSNELSDPSNKQKFVLDDRPAAKALRVLLNNPSEEVTYFNLQRYLKHHYLQNTDTVVKKKPEAVVKKVVEQVVEPVVEVVSAPVKKKVMVVKKKVAATELAEEA